jgi:hypothetical protein
MLLSVGRIPEKLNRIYVARDRENPAARYEINVARLTCTCSDFADKRRDFAQGDARRVCEHLYDKLYQTKAERAFDPLVQLFIRYGRSMLAYSLVEDALGRFVIGLPFGPRYARVIGVIEGKPLVATYDFKGGEWSERETPLTPARAAELLERVRRVYPAALA